MGRLNEIVNKKVTPGDEICVIEEFMAGHGAYEDDKGWVRSSYIGVTVADMLARTVAVKPYVRVPELPRKGEYVYGVVVHVKDEYAVVRIISSATGKRFRDYYTGIIHISQASDRFVRSLFDAVREGDIVKARALTTRIPVNLSIREPRTGVVAAFCSRCGALLKYRGGKLVCPECGNVEKRSVSAEYGVLKGLI